MVSRYSHTRSLGVGRHPDYCETKHLLSQPAQTLNSNDVSSHDTLSPHPVEDRNASAKQRRDLSGIRVIGDTNSSFRTYRGILAVPAISHYSADTLVLAHLELTPCTLLARETVAAMPSATDTIADLPLGFRGRDSDDRAYELVAESFDAAGRVVSGVRWQMEA